MKKTTTEAARSKSSQLQLLTVRPLQFTGCSYSNICKWVSGQDIWDWDCHRTYTYTVWWMSWHQVECSEIIQSSNSPRCAEFSLWDTHTQIFAEGFRDKIFNAEIITALGGALGDKDYNARQSAVEIFTAVIAQGVLSSFFMFMFMLKYLQTTFGTRNLRWSLLLHLDVHWDFMIPMSEGVQ